ncbi:MAG: dTMP kinase [Planctomycetia bacterium]|nr:dTMP kinase [Planctomycetia bacterium]
MRPLFISLDGADGVGKSTQIELLRAWLAARGQNVVTCRDPGATPLGEKIRHLLLHTEGLAISRKSELLLYMASRAQLVEEIIAPALAAGKTVLSDRYLLASVVYQGHAGGLPTGDIWKVGKVATGGLLPDLTIVLDAPPETTDARMQRERDRMERQGDAFRDHLRQGYLTEAATQPQNIIVIDAAREIAAVQSDIQAAVERVLTLPSRTIEG